MAVQENPSQPPPSPLGGGPQPTVKMLPQIQAQLNATNTDLPPISPSPSDLLGTTQGAGAPTGWE